MRLPDGLPTDIDLTRPRAARVHDEYTGMMHADLPDEPGDPGEHPERLGAFGGVGRHDHGAG
ncbi:hypothetical protein GCM10022225_03330 [Plantactinospora mayteni]|uniref:Uncharacterized protein n=1 Tax=Plantactinospora mayteni TaxID=566021 RepID=A0ABQ4EQ90_9ACTN|nr:hypothetical protein [Plantactinospora mayteni]GIG96821.1 hypothetical protein Pma05_33940 [Plantactinospora mayteni]